MKALEDKQMTKRIKIFGNGSFCVAEDGDWISSRDYDALAAELKECQRTRSEWCQRAANEHLRVIALETAINKIYWKGATAPPAHYTDTMTRIIDLCCAVTSLTPLEDVI